MGKHAIGKNLVFIVFAKHGEIFHLSRICWQNLEVDDEVGESTHFGVQKAHLERKFVLLMGLLYVLL